MAFWRRLGALLSGAGYRQEGLQGGNPRYSEPSAVPVTLDTSLQLSAVWACTKLLSECVGSLPINIYKIDKDGTRTLAKDHPLYKLLNGKPNQWQTRQEYFETLMFQHVLLGNDYSVIGRNGRGEIVSLMPLMSEQMEVRLLSDGSISYKYTEGSDVNVYSDRSVWHNKGFGNGIVGLSTFDYMRQSLGIALASEKATTKIYRNGGRPSGLLTMDNLLKPEQKEEIRKNFANLTENIDDGRLFVLENGMKFQQVSLSPQDIELLASRRFQIEDIARFFGVPSVLINDTNAATTWGSGIQQIVNGFYKLTLRPYLERYEASMKARLLTPQERLEYDIEFDFNALLRPDKSERVKSYKEAIMSGQMTPNEARAIEGDKPLSGGDNAFMQQQMTPIDQLPVKNGNNTTNDV